LTRFVLLSAFFLGGCSESALNYTKEDPVVILPGGISGRVCDPSGRTWLPDALAYVNLVDSDGRIYDTVQAYSDIDGNWSLGDLPGEREYTVYVQYGTEVLQEETVWVPSDTDVALEEPDCFDPLSLDIAIVTGDYDNFDIVLNQLGFANYELVDGQDGDVLNAFLGDPEELSRFDIIFFNGGFVEDGTIYDLEDSTNTQVIQNVQNVVDYVNSGGVIFGSDWSYDLVERGWPDRIDWVGADEIPDDAQKGDYDLVTAAVSDASLAEFLGEDYLDIQYDLPVWPPIEAVGEGVSVHLSGNVPYSDGLSEYSLTAVPLLVSFNSEQGKVAFSTFRVVPNSSDDMLAILQYMMYQL
jgi:hypothetical protein